MKKMNRFLALGMTAAMLGSVLAGCGSGNTAQGSGTHMHAYDVNGDWLGCATR